MSTQENLNKPPEEVSQEESDGATQSSIRRVPAWLLSTITHLVILVTLGLLIRPVVKGVEGEPGRTAGIVIAATANAQTEYFSEEDLSEIDQSEAVQTESASPDSAFPNQNDSPLDTTGVFPTLDGLVGPAGQQNASLSNTGELIEGLGSGGPIGDSTSTQVFGAQGTGSKFVYVFDRSSSMSGFGGRPLAAAQQELIASLAGLEETNQFQIIFYNDDPSIFNPFPNREPRLLFGTEENIEHARRFVQAIRAAGGTMHLDPLSRAMDMSPDVIFFLTDAQEPQLNEQELRSIVRRNRSAASINTIEFGAGPQRSRDNFLMKIARQNNGQHVYVDVTKLPAVR